MGKICVTCTRILFYFFHDSLYIFRSLEQKKGLSNQEHSLGAEHQTLFVIKNNCSYSLLWWHLEYCVCLQKVFLKNNGEHMLAIGGGGAEK